ncbi:Aldo/keto reductase [Epithele typhae]|uniref:Aldo/keto reductase n=1 Tax=Epithele typhae TaxID=378194 RepID=UPI002008DD50|nr:Aldo/keto reductase [Epithele typhae]KAH9922292.1 Aldo/keto reductase [Epithele typhae]
MSNPWAQPPHPATNLGRHRPLAPACGLHVSPLQLGAMSIGDKWAQFGMGAMDKESSFKLLDAFYEAGGNFIDTASNYQDETSEQFIGEWMETRGIRTQMVIATKYSTNAKRGRTDIKQHTAWAGNSFKTMRVSVDEALEKLRTSYIDIFYVHWWDYTTPIEEVMDGLHQLVMSGKVLYLGISDTPAWIVASANRYARMAHKTPFVIYQGSWSVLDRDFERDIIPLARHEGMALAPWNVLAGGKIRTDAEEQARLDSGEGGRGTFGPWMRNEREKAVAKVLEEVAKEAGTDSIQAVAIAYVMQRTPHVFPIIGGRKVEHLHGNIKALSIALSEEQIQKIEAASPFDKGSLYNIFGDGSDYGAFHKSAGHFDRWPTAPALRPKAQ